MNARSGDGEYLNGSPNAIAGAAVYDCCPGANHEEVCEESGTLPERFELAETNQSGF